MKRTRRYRVPLTTILATVLFLALTFESTPSDPAPTDPYLMPPRDEAAETQDLARFLVQGTGATDGRFHAFHLGDLATAADPAAASRQLSLLDPGPDPEAQRRFLHKMPYGTAIALAAERHHVDGLLLAAIVAVESGFSADAVSPQGALGLMQVIPDVAADYGVKGDLLDPYVNMEVGSRFMGGLIKDYKGDLERALAAYNAGPGVVDRYKGVPPYSETRGYVREVLAQYAEYNRKAGIHPVRTAER
jgi:soluble lytic murein transglycosylase-like protein